MKLTYTSVIVSFIEAILALLFVYYITIPIISYIILGIMFGIYEFVVDIEIPLKRRIIVATLLVVLWLPIIVEYVYGKVIVNV